MESTSIPSPMLENAYKKALVGIRAHTIDILMEGGRLMATHRRAFGDNCTDISDYSTKLAIRLKNFDAWGNRR